MHENLIAQLTDTGLTRNEALAYVTLLESDSPEGLTGYEVAARSKVPRSAVYSVLRRLEENGAAFAHGCEPARYVATDPLKLVDLMSRRTRAQFDTLRETLGRLPKRDRPEPIWILSRYTEVMTRIDRMIRGARRSVWLSVWPRELALLEGALLSAAERDLHCVLHSPAIVRPEPRGFSCWVDEVASDDEAKATWSHKALVVIDRREALIGGTEPDADNHAVWTTNPSLVDTATNHIILDITLMARTRGIDPVGVVSPMMLPHLPVMDDPCGDDPSTVGVAS